MLSDLSALEQLAEARDGADSRIAELQEAYDRLNVEHVRLRDEYAKLQNEFNEWIELIESNG